MTHSNSFRLAAAGNALAAVTVLLLTSLAAGAQSLSVLPVNIFLPPGQSATSLTVTNHGTSETAIQIRAFAWNQNNGEDQLTSSDAVVVSPPLASIAPGATQVVRLILRKPPQGQESTYRILVDQIPPPAEAGIVHIVLRLSMPIFAQPTTRAVAHVQFHLEYDAGQVYLVGVNDGLRHEAIRDIELITGAGDKLKSDSGVSPYILAGQTRRWRIATQSSVPLPSEGLRLTAHADAGPIEQQVQVVAKP
jgi:fimbrial chaperone protein